MASGLGGAGVWALWKAAGGAAPSLSSLNFTLGDTAGGGLSIIATGTNLSSASAVTIGGNSATITGNTSTTVTFTLPAHASGSVNVTVTTAGGTSNALSFEYWTPSQVTGGVIWYDAERGVTQSSNNVSQWADQGGGGVNASQSTGAQKPVWTASVFGSLHSLRFTRANSSLLTLTAQTVGTIGAVTYRAGIKSTDATGTAGGAAGVDAANNLFGGSSGGGTANCGMGGGGTAGNVAVYAFDGSAWQPCLGGSSVNDGNPHIIGANINGNTKVVQAVKDGANVGSAGTLGAGGFVDVAGFDSIGCGFSGLDPFGGDLGWLLFLPAAISGGDDTKLTAWSKQRWGTP